MLIKNGNVYIDGGFKKRDILIGDGKIIKIAKHLFNDNDYTDEDIDAEEKMVLPGAIDVHTHMNLDVGFAKANDDFYTGTIAAACGGTTTIVDHIGFGPEGCALDYQINHYHALAKDKAVIDYGFHGVIQHVDEDVLDMIETLANDGITSFKIYMTYSGRIRDDAILRVLEKTKALGVLIAAHAENNDIVEHLKAQFIKEEKTSPKYHPESRPILAEAEAVNRLLTIGRIAGDAPIYLVHISNGLSLEYIDFFRRRVYQNVFVETCPQYLYLDDRLYNKKDALKYVLSPPLRNRKNIPMMWQALALGEIDTIATDHCPFAYKTDKQMGRDDFTKCPNGLPGVELRYPLMLSAAVEEKLTFNRVIETCVKNPAKLFGLYPKKGEIKKGSDADLVIFNPKIKSRVTHDMLHEHVDYTPYEGIKTTGKIEAVLSRGKIVVKDNQFIGEKGWGAFIKRKKSMRP